MQEERGNSLISLELAQYFNNLEILFFIEKEKKNCHIFLTIKPFWRLGDWPYQKCTLKKTEDTEPNR